MPTIARIGPYRVYCYSHDMQEPAICMWIVITMAAKFCLVPVALAYNIGFRAKELRDIQRIVSERSAEFLEAWNDYFGT